MNKRLYPNRRQLNRILSAWMLISSVFLYVLWMPIPGARYIGWIGFAGVWLAALIVAYKLRIRRERNSMRTIAVKKDLSA